MKEKNGWKRQFTASGERLKEAVDLYRKLGFEVMLEKAETECGECSDKDIKTIWIRKKK